MSAALRMLAAGFTLLLLAAGWSLYRTSAMDVMLSTSFCG